MTKLYFPFSSSPTVFRNHVLFVSISPLQVPPHSGKFSTIRSGFSALLVCVYECTPTVEKFSNIRFNLSSYQSQLPFTHSHFVKIFNKQERALHLSRKPWQPFARALEINADHLPVFIKLFSQEAKVRNPQLWVEYCKPIKDVQHWWQVTLFAITW